MNTENKSNKFLKMIIIGILLVLLLYHFMHRPAPQPAASNLPLVLTRKPKMQEMADYVKQTGNTVAYNSVNLVARVEGYLEQINFVDGTFIKKGIDLFLIEPQPYLDKVEEAEASLAAAKAGYVYAKTEYARQQGMYKQNATSLKNVEKWGAKQDQSAAEVSKAEANLNTAQINYSYTHVKSPFDGRIGRHLVDIGNLVGHGQATNLATVEQIQPIYVYFNLNELDLIKLRKAAKARGFKPSEIDKIPVYVGMQTQSGFPYQGKLNFVNTGLNASTGTMQFRALLQNEDYHLLPGLFVHVRIPVTTPKKQLTVPDTAIQYDQIGPYLLLVDKENFVALRRVSLGSLENGERAILKGISDGDNVIVDGLQFAVPGNAVRTKGQEDVDAEPTNQSEKNKK